MVEKKQDSFIKRVFENPVYLLDSDKLKSSDKILEKLMLQSLTACLRIVGFFFIIAVSNFNYYNSILAFAWFFYTYLAIARSVPLIAYEKERRTLEPLRTTLLRPIDVIRGKFMAVFIPLLVEISIFYCILTMFSVIQYRSILPLTICILIWMFHLIFTSMAIFVVFAISYDSNFLSCHYTYPAGIMIIIYLFLSLFWNYMLVDKKVDALQLLLFQIDIQYYLGSYSSMFFVSVIILCFTFLLILTGQFYQTLLSWASKIPDQ